MNKLGLMDMRSTLQASGFQERPSALPGAAQCALCRPRVRPLDFAGEKPPDPYAPGGVLGASLDLTGSFLLQKETPPC